MIIDFHSHIFPDRIAAKALDHLTSFMKMQPTTDGTANGLLSSMRENGIHTSVLLPVVTAPHQFDSILRFAQTINEQNYSDDARLISFGGIHPDCSDLREKLLQIKSAGLKGIKLHPNYQFTRFDSSAYKIILYYASELDLIVSVHCGVDLYTPGKLYCTPQMIKQVVHEVQPARLILAHMGSNEMEDEVLEYLCEEPVYFDTGYSIAHMDPEKFVKIVKMHGAHRILFGTDSPWSDASEDVKILQNMTALSPSEKEQIFYKNALSLLGS